MALSAIPAAVFLSVRKLLPGTERSLAHGLAGCHGWGLGVTGPSSRSGRVLLVTNREAKGVPFPEELWLHGGGM